MWKGSLIVSTLNGTPHTQSALYLVCSVFLTYRYSTDIRWNTVYGTVQPVMRKLVMWPSSDERPDFTWQLFYLTYLRQESAWFGRPFLFHLGQSLIAGFNQSFDGCGSLPWYLCLMMYSGHRSGDYLGGVLSQRPNNHGIMISTYHHFIWSP